MSHRKEDNGVAQHWTIDKRIPLALIVTLIVQMVYVVYRDGVHSNTLEDHTRRITQAENNDTRREADMRDVFSRLARLETNVANIGATTDRIERLLHEKLGKRAELMLPDLEERTPR